MKKKIVIIGSGFMAGAIAGAVAENNLYDTGILNPVDSAGADRLANQIKGYVCGPEDIRNADVIVLAFKPQNLDDAALQYRPYINNKILVVSIMAGKNLSEISDKLGGTEKIIRVMPNIAVAVRKGAIGYCIYNGVSADDEKMFADVFCPLGVLVKVDETLMSAVTALSGSGPAYFYYLCKYMKEEGVKLGLDENTAEMLTRATLEGSASLVMEKADVSFEDLLKSITSAKGTTEAALGVLDNANVGQTIMDAEKAACIKSDELGRNV